MSIPNTTPTPNKLYNGEMKKMSDTELRVVLIVTRATFGWVIDKETGMRKQEDWISQKQLMLKSGRTNRAISSAVKSCVVKKWIEARDRFGSILKTPEERSGKKIFYRLGQIFLKRITSEDSSQVRKPVNLTTQTSELNDIKPVKIVHSTKETLTKENIQKIITKSNNGKPKSYGNPLLNKFLLYLKEKTEVIDTPVKYQRTEGWILIRKMKSLAKEKKGCEPTDDEVWNGLKFLIDMACDDKFHCQHAGKIKYLYNNIGAIVKSKLNKGKGITI